ELAGVVRGNAAIDLDVDVAAGDQPADLANLAEAVVDEGLAAEAGVHAHDEDEVDVVDDVLEHRDGRGGIDGDAGALALGADRLQRPVQVRPCLGVDGDDVGAGAREGSDVGIDRGDHQVAVEHLGGQRAQRRHHQRPDGEVGDEMAVHDVDVDIVGATLVDGPDLLAEAGEIGGEDRGGDANGWGRHGVLSAALGMGGAYPFGGSADTGRGGAVAEGA